MDDEKPLHRPLTMAEIMQAARSLEQKGLIKKKRDPYGNVVTRNGQPATLPSGMASQIARTDSRHPRRARPQRQRRAARCLPRRASAAEARPGAAVAGAHRPAAPTPFWRTAPTVPWRAATVMHLWRRSPPSARRRRFRSSSRPAVTPAAPADKTGAS